MERTCDRAVVERFRCLNRLIGCKSADGIDAGKTISWYTEDYIDAAVGDPPNVGIYEADGGEAYYFIPERFKKRFLAYIRKLEITKN